jgi:hypothetical protein
MTAAPTVRRLGRSLPLLLIVAALLTAVLVGRPDGPHLPPLDPRSAEGDGTKALLDTLRALGADVDVADAPTENDEVTLVLVDRFDDGPHQVLARWVRGGGTLVVADPSSPLAPEVRAVTTITGFESTIQRRCGLAPLVGVERVAAPGSAVYEVPARAVGCFPRNGGHWLVASDLGRGVVVALGGPEPLVNASLGEADNAALAAALLLPRPRARVVVLRPPPPGEGDAGLRDLLPARVGLALAQLGVAFLVVVAWRARRLGRPVSELQPVAVPGSELVVAVGNLLQQTRGRERAARLLREDLRRGLAERLGLPRTALPEQVAAAAARRQISPESVTELLTGPAPRSEADLLALARRVEHVRREVLAVSSGHAGGKAVPARPSRAGG